MIAGKYIFFISLSLILVSVCAKIDGVSINTYTDNANKSMEVLNTQKKEIESIWEYKHQPNSWTACSGIPVVIDSEAKSRTFRIQNNRSTALAVTSMEMEFDQNILLIDVTKIEEEYLIEPNKSEEIKFDYQCHPAIRERDYTYVKWTLKLYDNITQTQSSEYEISYLKLCPAKYSRFDYSILTLMVSACIIVYFSSLQKPVVVGDSSEDQEFRTGHALGFLIVGSLGLIGLFYFHKYLVPIMTVGISFVALSACQLILTELVVAFFGSRTLVKIMKLPFVGDVTGADSVGFLGASIIILAYLATKNWIFNNIIGVMLIFTMMKIVRMTNYKVAALLLGLAFFYDIFWVFFSDRFFGTSVMASVATRVDLPMKLVCPIMRAYPIPRCSILGLGDMVLPGFFVAFCHNFDNLIKQRVYHKTCFIGYCTGLVICMFCLIVYDSAQPALLYLSPCTLIPVFLQAQSRNEVDALWNGKVGGRTLSNEKKDQNKKTSGDDETFDKIEYKEVPPRDIEMK